MYKHDVKCDYINRCVQIYYVDEKDFIDIEFENNDFILI
jgi:hypothetical protein